MFRTLGFYLLSKRTDRDGIGSQDTRGDDPRSIEARFVNRGDRSCFRESCATFSSNEYGNADVDNVGATCVEASLHADCER